MKSFLLKEGKPIIKWGQLPSNTFFVGEVPEGYDLAVVPSDNFIVLDVDVKNNKNGFNFIPIKILEELNKSFYYDTKSGGRHYWLEYMGNLVLSNRATKLGLDLRVAEKGYVKYVHSKDIRECIHLINKTSPELNKWLEKHFSLVIELT